MEKKTTSELRERLIDKDAEAEPIAFTLSAKELR